MVKKLPIMMMLGAVSAFGSVNAMAQQVAPTASDSVATVYFVKNITSENLLKIYDALDRRASSRVKEKPGCIREDGMTTLKSSGAKVCRSRMISSRQWQRPRKP